MDLFSIRSEKTYYCEHRGIYKPFHESMLAKPRQASIMSTLNIH